MTAPGMNTARRTLWLQRHAPVVAEPGLCYGATNLQAHAQGTRDAAQRIAPLLPAGLVLLSSPLRRCAELADAIVALRPDLQLRHDARLAEMDFGAWEGRPWADIPREDFEAWTADFADAPAGAHGESVRDFMGRVAAVHDEWQAGEGDALWVTHAGVLRAVTLLQRGMRCVQTAADWPVGELAFGGWLTFERSPG
ncbi:histidine phosphatase family protein [Variovorax sp. RCC_210]|uniref:histidine phosphatase family protein n=1 Tax=Variovorax sp. RCC_210 TaxID=3239217 RepID=UPI0035252F33